MWGNGRQQGYRQGQSRQPGWSAQEQGLHKEQFHPYHQGEPAVGSDLQGVPYQDANQDGGQKGAPIAA
jgi:hypothetical protein